MRATRTIHRMRNVHMPQYSAHRTAPCKVKCRDNIKRNLIKIWRADKHRKETTQVACPACPVCICICVIL